MMKYFGKSEFKPSFHSSLELLFVFFKWTKVKKASQSRRAWANTEPTEATLLVSALLKRAKCKIWAYRCVKECVWVCICASKSVWSCYTASMSSTLHLGLQLQLLEPLTSPGADDEHTRLHAHTHRCAPDRNVNRYEILRVRRPPPPPPPPHD